MVKVEWLEPASDSTGVPSTSAKLAISSLVAGTSSEDAEVEFGVSNGVVISETEGICEAGHTSELKRSPGLVMSETDGSSNSEM